MLEDPVAVCQALAGIHGGTFVRFDGGYRRVTNDTLTPLPDGLTYQKADGSRISRQELIDAYWRHLDRDLGVYAPTQHAGPPAAVTPQKSPENVPSVGAIPLLTPVRVCYLTAYACSSGSEEERVKAFVDELWLREVVGYLAFDDTRAIALTTELSPEPMKFSVVIPRQAIEVMRALQ